MIAYVVLCVRLGFVLPGSPTIPDQIAADRTPYYLALDAADAAYRVGNAVDVSVMEGIVTDMLVVQLAGVGNKAKFPDMPSTQRPATL